MIQQYHCSIMAIEVQVRKWGNSKAVILPYEYAKRVEIGETLLIEPMKKLNMKNVFGLLQRKSTGQELKDEARQIWDK